MKIEAFLIGFAIFSLFIVTGVFMITDINVNYAGIIEDNISTSDFNNTYNTINEMYNISQDQSEAVIGSELERLTISESSYQGTITAVRMVRRTFTLMGDIVRDISQTIGIPTYFITIFLTIMLITVIFGIIKIILRFRE